MRLIAVAACLIAGAAQAAPAPKPAPVKAWVGTFDPQTPKKPCTADCKLVPTPHAGVVIVLSPSDGSEAASGDVVVVHPLLGAIASGHVDKSRVTLAQFSYDPNRDGDDGVLVLPGGTPAKLVDASKADVAAIRATLLRDEALAGVRKALNNLEVGAVDIDGDGKADFAVTYGCNGWADGECQSRGQFFLAHRGARWVQLE